MLVGTLSNMYAEEKTYTLAKNTWQPTGPVGRRGGAKQAGLKVCREESLDTSVQNGREKICGGDIHIGC